MKHWLLLSAALICFSSTASAQEGAPAVLPPPAEVTVIIPLKPEAPLPPEPAALKANRPYFRLLDPAHIQQSAGMLYDPSGVNNSAGITDISIITHSTEDGSIIPKAWQGVLPPENWTLLSMGFGGSLSGDAIIGIGTSINVAPQLGALAMRGINENSAPWARAIKDAFLGNGKGRVRIGWAEVGTVVRAGVFQSPKQAFPGQGPIDILRRAGRVEVGWGWVW